MSHSQTKSRKQFWKPLNQYIDELSRDEGDIKARLLELPSNLQEIVLKQREPLVQKLFKQDSLLLNNIKMETLKLKTGKISQNTRTTLIKNLLISIGYAVATDDDYIIISVVKKQKVPAIIIDMDTRSVYIHNKGYWSDLGMQIFYNISGCLKGFDIIPVDLDYYITENSIEL